MTTQTLVDVRCTINGTPRVLSVRAGETVLQTLRERLGLTGTKEGCLEGECGSCTVLLDGDPVDSCLLASATLDGRRVRTVESLAHGHELSPLQQAFLDHGAVQCGFCTPGFLMTLTALLERTDQPTADDVCEAIAGNICRCTGYRQMLDAVAQVAADGVSGGGETEDER